MLRGVRLEVATPHLTGASGASGTIGVLTFAGGFVESGGSWDAKGAKGLAFCYKILKPLSWVFSNHSLTSGICLSIK